MLILSELLRHTASVLMQPLSRNNSTWDWLILRHCLQGNGALDQGQATQCLRG